MATKTPTRITPESDEPSTSAAPAYIDLIFSTYWKLHRVQEPPKYFSLREAIYSLTQASGTLLNQVAANLGLNVSRFNAIAQRGGPLMPYQWEILIRLAKAYSMPVLVEFFDSAMAVAVEQAPGRRGRRPKPGLDSGGSEPGWMKAIGDG